MVSAEWVAVGIQTGVVAGGVLVTFIKIGIGQAVAKVREKQHTEEIGSINRKLDQIINGESKCKLDFTGRIATLEQKATSIQNELTEHKDK